MFGLLSYVVMQMDVLRYREGETSHLHNIQNLL